MTSELTPAAPAPSRRSRREGSIRDEQQVPEAQPLTRAELRRQRAATSPATHEASVTFAADDVSVEEVLVVEETDSHISVEETHDVAAVPAGTGIIRVVDEESHGAESAPADEPVDAFGEAAAVFAFTGEVPTSHAADSDEAPEAAAAESAEPAHAVARGGRRRGRSFRRVAATSFSVAVMGVVGLLAVGMTTPSQAVAAGIPTNVTPGLAGDVAYTDGTIQAYIASDQVQDLALDRSSGYSTTTLSELAAESGISHFSNFFVNNPNSPIQWPFSVGVPISYGFGMRDGGMHQGVDFTPGEGSPVQAIADGTVRIATENGGAYGVTVVIDHQIDGQLVSSRYGHMLVGSLKVKQGDKITVGTVIGNTGNTGRSFGAHTHVEILMNGATPIDPIPWLREHAGG